MPQRGINNLARNVCSEVRLEFYEWQGKHITVYFPSQEIALPSIYDYCYLYLQTPSTGKENSPTIPKE